MVERDGKVKAKKQDKGKLKFKNLQRIVKEHIDTKQATLITDDYRGYTPFSSVMSHKIINHSQKQYTDGDIHTNTIECFWALLKRGIVGQYHKVSVKYLNKYINEFCFKYNHRNDINVFDLLIEKGVSI